MKKIVLFVLFGISAHAQEWNPDLESAKRQAAESGKKVLLYFSAAESCQPCQNLEQTVFASPEFIAYADKNYVLARPVFAAAASFAEKADNLLIVEKYNKDGFFPWVVILDSKGKVVNKVGQYDNEPPLTYLKKLERS